MYIQYDPDKHRGLPLFELLSRETDDGIETALVLTNVDLDMAAQTPHWYYVVKVKDRESDANT